jgi:hypothetical protein
METIQAVNLFIDELEEKLREQIAADSKKHELHNKSRLRKLS